MKQIWRVMLAGMAAVVMAGCQSESAAPSAEPATTTEAVESSTGGAAPAAEAAASPVPGAAGSGSSRLDEAGGISAMHGQVSTGR